MMMIGISTGALALGDYRQALGIARGCGVAAVELSALREEELALLIRDLPTLDLASYAFVSVHAPSRLRRLSERQLRDELDPAFQMALPVILHADVIEDTRLWIDAGRLVCVENMDLRKRTGQKADQIQRLIDRLPDASICFDIGHARQVDRTMTEAASFLHSFRERITELHISEVNHHGTHLPLTAFSVRSFRQIANLLPDVPAILETPADQATLRSQIDLAQRALTPAADLLIVNN